MSNKIKWQDVPSALRYLSDDHNNVQKLTKWLRVDNTNPIWYKDAGLRSNVAHGLGLCLVIATNVGQIAFVRLSNSNTNSLQGCEFSC